MKMKWTLLLGIGIAMLTAVSAFGADGVIKDSRTLVPVRGVFEELGFSVEWNSSSETATILDNHHIILVVKGENYIHANGEKVYPDVPQQVINNHFYLPLKAIGDCIGAKTTWDSNKKMAVISYNGKTAKVYCDPRYKEEDTMPVSTTKETTTKKVETTTKKVETTTKKSLKTTEKTTETTTQTVSTVSETQTETTTKEKNQGQTNKKEDTGEVIPAGISKEVHDGVLTLIRRAKETFSYKNLSKGDISSDRVLEAHDSVIKAVKEDMRTGKSDMVAYDYVVKMYEAIVYYFEVNSGHTKLDLVYNVAGVNTTGIDKAMDKCNKEFMEKAEQYANTDNELERSRLLAEMYDALVKAAEADQKAMKKIS